MKRLVIVFVGLFFALMFIASCGAEAPMPAPAAPAPAADFAPAAEPEAAAPAPPPAPAAPAPAPAADAPTPAPAAPAAPAPAPAAPGAPTPSEPYLTPPILAPFERGRAFAYTVTFDLQTIDFMPQMRYIFNTIGRLGGYTLSAQIEGRDLRQPYFERNGRFTFRVPSYHLNELKVAMENSFNYLWFNMTIDDETAAYRQVVSQLDELRELETWILQEIAGLDEDDAAGIRDMTAWLNQVRRSIRQTEEAQADIVYTVVYSTVFIRLFEVVFPEEPVEEEPEPEPPLPTFGERLNQTLASAGEAFASIGQGLLLALITISPVLIIIAIIVVVVIVAKSRMKKRGKLRPKKSVSNDNDDADDDDDNNSNN